MPPARAFALARLLAAGLLLAGCAAPASPPPAAVELTVAAAADLQFAFTDLAALFEQQTGHRVTLVFGSTGQLAQQIANGAPYDLFAAANISYVEDLAAQGLLLASTIAPYAQGRIVLAVNRAAGVQAESLEDDEETLVTDEGPAVIDENAQAERDDGTQS